MLTLPTKKRASKANDAIPTECFLSDYSRWDLTLGLSILKPRHQFCCFVSDVSGSHLGKNI